MHQNVSPSNQDSLEKTGRFSAHGMFTGLNRSVGLALKITAILCLLLAGGGGVSAGDLFDPDNIPDLPDSHLLAIASVDAGLRFPVYCRGKETCTITMGYAVHHASDPFKHADDGDSGWNLGAVSFSVSTRF
ncbi:MAG: hypothetical protein R6V54_01825 [Desulfobacteraceae bacterium]